MGLLHVYLLGNFQVSYDEFAMEIKMTHSIQRLWAYLILFNHRNHPREILAEVLWGDKNQARSRDSLNTALWQLRKPFESFGISRDTFLFTDNPNEIRFNKNGPLWLDVREFQESTHQVIQSQSADISEVQLLRLENAIELYRGDLLEGFYDDWVIREREHLRIRYFSTLFYLMRIYHKRNEYEKSLACGQKILELDPLREDIHRYMIQLFTETGQRALAARQFELCRESLAGELHIEPMEETRELYNQLISNNTYSSSRVQFDSTSELQQALSQLYQARSAFELARDQLILTIEIVDRAIKSLRI